MDIRKFFSPVRKSTSSNQSKDSSKGSKRKRIENDDDFRDPKKKLTSKKGKGKKGNIIFDSDSDDDVQVVANTPPKQKTGNGVKKGSHTVRSTPPRKAKQATPVKKNVSALDFFGAEPVKQSEKKSEKSKRRETENGGRSKIPKLELENHEDESFQETLKQLDQKGSPKKSSKSGSFASKLAEKAKASSVLVPDTPEPSSKKTSVKREKPSVGGTPVKRVNGNGSPRKSKEESRTPPKAKASPHTPDKKKSKSKFKHSIEITKTATPKPETSPPGKSGGRSVEKKRGGPAYRSYLQREGPRYVGEKEIPEGEEGCFKDLSFVITGVLDYIEKEDAKALIESLGGAVRTSVSKKTSYLIIGRDPGESKTQKAMDFKVEQINEEELYDLIRTKPGTGKRRKVKSMSKDTPEETSESTSPKKKEKISEKAEKHENSEKSTQNSEQFNSQESTDYSQESLGKVDAQEKEKSTGQSEQSYLMWVDKYRPQSTKQIIGQQGDRSNVRKLSKWLRLWNDNNFGCNKSKAKFNREDGFSYKAALLSGPPGVGKTTSAQLVCKEEGFTYFELNASDARNKKSLEQYVSEYLNNMVLGIMFSGNVKGNERKHCLIMDEVDGMSGNEDRGGIQELIQLIKGSHIPVICICNDRGSSKMRSLVNQCFDLRFHRPRLNQIKVAMLSVAFKEGMSIPAKSLENLISATNHDVRQVLHNMSMLAADKNKLNQDDADKSAKAAKKDLKLGSWGVIEKIFSYNAERKNMNLNDKIALFFHDYSITPLFVQENYLKVIPYNSKGDIKKYLSQVSRTADSLAMGDLVEKQIRSNMKWNLLPTLAIFSTVLPGEYLQGHMSGMVNFPSWFGKYSTKGKNSRLLQGLTLHMRKSTSSALQAINQEYLPHLRKRLTDPLLKEGTEGVPDVIELMNSYDLTREDFESIMEVTQYAGVKNPMNNVPTKVKSAFTRAYNKDSHMTPYAIDSFKKLRGKKKAVTDEEGMLEEEEAASQEDEEDSDDDDISSSAMIKVKQMGGDAKKGSKGKAPAKGGTKGKGKK